MKIKKLIVLVLLGLLTSGLVYQVAAIETFPETQSEINVTGRLYRLKPVHAGNRQEHNISPRLLDRCFGRHPKQNASAPEAERKRDKRPLIFKYTVISIC